MCDQVSGFLLLVRVWARGATLGGVCVHSPARSREIARALRHGIPNILRKMQILLEVWPRGIARVNPCSSVSACARYVGIYIHVRMCVFIHVYTSEDRHPSTSVCIPQSDACEEIAASSAKSATPSPRFPPPIRALLHSPSLY